MSPAGVNPIRPHSDASQQRKYNFTFCLAALRRAVCWCSSIPTASDSPRTVIGSAANSPLRISAILVLIAGFSFCRCAATTRLANARGINMRTQQLDPAFGDRVRIHTEQRGNSNITPSADLHCLQAGKQSSLPFIQQSEE